jgi:20S proteasome alpha/beta subunit
MTIAIGAICENSQTIVVASDRMVNYGPPTNLQTETASLKTTVITDTCLAICTGTVTDGEEVLKRAKSQLTSTLIREVAEAIKVHYAEHKKKRVEDLILRPLIGGEYAMFQQMLTASTASHLLIQIANAVFNHSLQLEVLIAGLDSAGPSLWVVSHPGAVHSLNQVGYAAFGSGGSFATARLGVGQQSKTATLATTLYNVYEAKRAAELGLGVGRLTDMAVITNAGIKYLPDEFIRHLDTLRQRVSVLSPADSAAIQKQYDSLTQ